MSSDCNQRDPFSQKFSGGPTDVIKSSIYIGLYSIIYINIYIYKGQSDSAVVQLVFARCSCHSSHCSTTTNHRPRALSTSSVNSLLIRGRSQTVAVIYIYDGVRDRPLLPVAACETWPI